VFISTLVAILLLAGCSPSENRIELPTGIWRATLAFQEAELPFNFEVSRDSANGYDITIMNAGERLLLDEVELKGDSVSIPLHIFDASLKAVFRNDTMSGTFIKHYDPLNTVPFTAVYGQTFRFSKPPENKASKNFSGKYRVVFQNEKDTTDAVGVFEQKGDSLTGTFLTQTGDYRYLQGNVVNDTLKLSGFDGNHAYLFVATFIGERELHGTFYSGKTRKSLWQAWLDEKAALPDPDSLTTLSQGYEKMDFTFPDPDSVMVSFSDRFKNKVVILQLFGTWCPNCMDETRFLVPWYNKNKSRGVEVVGLAFERKDDFGYASARVKRMADKMKVPFTLLIAGTNDKTKASEKLPMLNKIISFPTTVFVGKDGKIKKIHTGFSGPGTGKYYEEYIADFNETVDALLKEEPAPAAGL
jgi:thiol-disulfide isomerase/thioredoxin